MSIIVVQEKCPPQENLLIVNELSKLQGQVLHPILCYLLELIPQKQDQNQQTKVMSPFFLTSKYLRGMF